MQPVDKVRDLSIYSFLFSLYFSAFDVELTLEEFNACNPVQVSAPQYQSQPVVIGTAGGPPSPNVNQEFLKSSPKNNIYIKLLFFCKEFDRYVDELDSIRGYPPSISVFRKFLFNYFMKLFIS